MHPVHLELVPSFYHKYIQLVPPVSLKDALELYRTTLLPFVAAIPEEKWTHSYAPGKWTIKESVQHMIDTERIFAYRALAFARQDKAQLPGFDENAYTPASKANRRTSAELVAELELVHKSTVALFESFDAEMLAATGVANGNAIYVEGIGYIIVGHALHHLALFKERYLV
jgi:hypothetical protein